MKPAAELGRTLAPARRAGVERFLEVYGEAGLHPYSPADSELMRALGGCLNCGTCLSVCPVYGAAVEHRHSGPRSVGISLSRSTPDFWSAAEVVDACATCLACQEVCPGDVPVSRAALMIRAMNFERRARSGEDPLGRTKRLVVDLFMGDRLERVARLGAGVQGLAFRKTASGEMKSRLPSWLGPLASRVVPPLARVSLVREFSGAVPGRDPNGPRVAVFAGCLINHAYTGTGRNLVSVLLHHCREVVVPPEQVCCGAPAFYGGETAAASERAGRNAAVFAAAAVDRVITACASCGDMLSREYPSLAAGDRAVGEFSGKVLDVHAFLAGRDPPAAMHRDRAAGRRERPTGDVRRDPPAFARGEALRDRVVTVHDPCHLGRGQGLVREVRQVLRAVPGIRLREMADPGACCGGAGTFSLDHADLAEAVRRRKIEAIVAVGADLVVTGCPSCRMHLAGGLEASGRRLPIRHTVDLLAEAYGLSEDLDP